MKSTRTLSVMLAGLMLLLLFSGSALAYTSDRYSFGDMDFGGATVTMVCHFNIWAQFEEGGAYAGRIEEAKKLFNIGDIKVIQVGWGEVGNACLDRFLAGDSKYDIWRVPHHFFWTLVSNGALCPVSEILTADYFEKLPPITQARNEGLSYQGRRFQFSCGTDDYGHATFMVFNKDILDAEGLPDPYELYENDEWTFEAVTELARKCTKDTDGDGVIDQWGLSDFDPKNLAYAYGGTFTKRDDTGRVVFTMDEPAAIAGLRQWVEWRKVEQIASGGENEFGSGQIAMCNMPFYAISNSKWSFDYGVLPYPQGPYTDECLYLPGTADAMYVPSNAEYPLGLIALDNFLFPLEEYGEFLEGYIDDRVADRKSYGIFLEAMEKWDRSTDYYLNFLGDRWNGSMPYGKVCGDINNGISPATSVAEVKTAAQALIDEMFGQ